MTELRKHNGCDYYFLLRRFVCFACSFGGYYDDNENDDKEQPEVDVNGDDHAPGDHGDKDRDYDDEERKHDLFLISMSRTIN